MGDNQRPAADGDLRLENFAAELTSAVYPIILLRGLKGSWLNVQLNLWRGLAETVGEWDRRRPPAASAPEVEAWRSGLLGALAGRAFAVAVRDAANRPRPEGASGLYQAVREVMRRYCDVS